MIKKVLSAYRAFQELDRRKVKARTGGYLPVCVKYGKLPLFMIGAVIPGASAFVVGGYVGAASGNSLLAEAAFVSHFGLGVLAAYISQVTTERRVAGFLRSKEVGLNRGGKILRGWQVAVASVVTPLVAIMPAIVMTKIPFGAAPRIPSIAATHAPSKPHHNRQIVISLGANRLLPK